MLLLNRLKLKEIMYNLKKDSVKNYRKQEKMMKKRFDYVIILIILRLISNIRCLTIIFFLLMYKCTIYL